MLSVKKNLFYYFNFKNEIELYLDLFAKFIFIIFNNFYRVKRKISFEV